ncbi:DUF4118 domain-containing protein [Novosphingobium sp. JCM 18896]|uniref:DUF4118 domain-containing protein n=1 Tax=Novosphingobium sp. JCM 18896 TaxID=2989731 RepID=UPI00222381AC|nr:DUF4118 domain-containing protein [Novosphingobium sp. JCM 18896]MCW1431669.1 DUF4118 domain-containing protein [Novosphingobium sp. JCM 18896]
MDAGADTEKMGSDRIVVVIDGSAGAEKAVSLGRDLSRICNVPWEAILPVTRSVDPSLDDGRGAKALTLAVRLGASVSQVPAATMADAIAAHVSGYSRPHIVLALSPRSLIERLRAPSLAQSLVLRRPDLVVHMVAGDRAPRNGRAAGSSQSATAYVVAALAALATLALVFLLERATGTSYFSLLFLFPVITVAARAGFWPALFAALVSAAGFNVLFLAPVTAFDPLAAQTWLMFAVLAGIALYTSWLTGTLRDRLLLSDRSAQESAALASFAQDLTRVADWAATGEVVARDIGSLMHVHALVAREIDGRLRVIASHPCEVELDPLDHTALDWVWERGEAAGSGTGRISEASWQFHPLATSLGTLAILGLAREDGRDPVPPERRVLLATAIAQAALAHERLRLEDIARDQADASQIAGAHG